MPVVVLMKCCLMRLDEIVCGLCLRQTQAWGVGLWGHDCETIRCSNNIRNIPDICCDCKDNRSRSTSICQAFFVGFWSAAVSSSTSTSPPLGCR